MIKQIFIIEKIWSNNNVSYMSSDNESTSMMHHVTALADQQKFSKLSDKSPYIKYVRKYTGMVEMQTENEIKK